MNRIWTVTALGLAMACGGALAQQTSGQPTSGSAGASGETEVSAPASAETGIKGVYTTTRTLGISTGQSAVGDNAGAGDAEDNTSAEAKDEGDTKGEPASN